MKSLLNKNLMQFIGCILVIMVLVTPLFYFLTKNFYAEEMIESINDLRMGKSLEPSDLEEDIVEGMELQFVLLFAVLCLSLILVMRFLTRRLWGPFDDTLHKLELFNLEHSDIPHFVKSDIKEFERLNRSVEMLMRKDKETYSSQKEFTENASHELQTPIAVIQSKFDLLMQENLNERQATLVSEMINICNKLSRLNKNLLLLTKIENAQYHQTEKITLLSFVQNRIAVYSDLNISGRILLDENSEDITLQANVSLLESLLDNLVVNAIRHKPDGADVILSVKGGELSVENEGQNGQALDKTTLFKRFSNNGDKNRGNGLGLAIVKAICDYHHWTIRYLFNNGKHKFIIKF